MFPIRAAILLPPALTSTVLRHTSIAQHLAAKFPTQQAAGSMSSSAAEPPCGAEAPDGAQAVPPAAPAPDTGSAAPFKPKDPRKLLLAIDNSDDAVHALKWSLENIYRRDTDALHLMHVMASRTFGSWTSAYGIIPPIDHIPSQDELKEMEAGLLDSTKGFIERRFLSQLPDGLPAVPVVHLVKAELSAAQIGRMICKKAEELRAGMVIMASHNRGRIEEFFLGSVTSYVLHNCTVPVVVVRHPMVGK